MNTRFGTALLLLITLLHTAGFAQTVGRSTGPFVKINDLWLVYTRPGMIIEDGRVWVPARYFAAVAGMVFQANPAKSAVQIQFSGRNLDFKIGSSDFNVDGKTGSFAQATLVRSGRVMIPIAVVARAFGLSLRWGVYLKTAFLTGQGLAAELRGNGPSARFYLIENRTGIDVKVPEVTNLAPTSFQWRWKHGFYSTPYSNVPIVNFKTGSGFRLTWRRTGSIPKHTFVVMGLGTDDSSNSLGYFVRGYGQFGFPYTGDKDPNDREYCKFVVNSSLVCDVGPVLYSEPDHYPTEPKTVVGIPRFVFARVYTF